MRSKTPSGGLMLDVSRVPFSCAESYLTFVSLAADKTGREAGLYLRTVSGAARATEVVRVSLVRDGTPLEARIEATPSLLRMTDDATGEAEIVFETPTRLRFRVRGAMLRLSRGDWRPFDHVVPRGDRYLINSYENALYLMADRLSGRWGVDAPWERVRCTSMRIELSPDPSSGVGEMALDAFERQHNPVDRVVSFDACHAHVEARWNEWLDRHPVTKEEQTPARDLAAYINWSCLVAARGNFARPAMLMSKYKMTRLWSWDHCFNAMAYARIDPKLAWDQLMIPFDHIDADGGLPASITDTTMNQQAAKPPVHGWALGWMMDRCDWITRDHLSEIRGPLEAWTRWWMRYRRDGDERLPHADHGNDTGWDNATAFHDGLPVTTPDIPAYLVMQMQTLARIAEALHDESGARVWRSEAGQLQTDLLRALWVPGRGFVSRHADGRIVESGNCLIRFMPLILGQDLPPDVSVFMRNKLLEPGQFRTRWGLATESVASPLYDAQGYWRGPIWAPPMMILIDGLTRAGFGDDATQLAEDYRRLCAWSGFPENHHAETGQPLRDPAYTWTSSVYLALLAER